MPIEVTRLSYQIPYWRGLCNANASSSDTQWTCKIVVVDVATSMHDIISKRSEFCNTQTVVTMNETMDRGSNALKAHVTDASTMSIRQTRRGWLQECLGCEARNEFKIFVGDNQIAEALEDASCMCRLCCSPIHPFTMEVKVRLKEVERVGCRQTC